MALLLVNCNAYATTSINIFSSATTVFITNSYLIYHLQPVPSVALNDRVWYRDFTEQSEVSVLSASLCQLRVPLHCQKTPRTDGKEGEEKNKTVWGARLTVLPQFATPCAVD